MHGHNEPIERMKQHGILIDGEGVVDGGETKILLQIFSKTVIGPIFFEFIQRKGDDGFGEGNFRALFESIEEDQIRRGVLKVGGGLASVIPALVAGIHLSTNAGASDGWIPRTSPRLSG